MARTKTTRAKKPLNPWDLAQTWEVVRGNQFEPPGPLEPGGEVLRVDVGAAGLHDHLLVRGPPGRLLHHVRRPGAGRPCDRRLWLLQR
jgi:hypothetical protein